MIKIKNKVVTLLVLLVTILTLVAGFFFYKYWQVTHNKPEQQNEELVSYIGKLVELPSEKPTIATVLETDKLSNKTLRSRAQNNDNLLIYPKAKRLILYRPSSKKVIEMLTIQDKSPPNGDIEQES